MLITSQQTSNYALNQKYPSSIGNEHMTIRMGDQPVYLTEDSGL